MKGGASRSFWFNLAITARGVGLPVPPADASSVSRKPDPRTCADSNS
jgi:hypothetical protein